MPALKTASGIHSLSVAATAAAVACVAAAEAASLKGAGVKDASLEAREGMALFDWLGV
jgi:predicted lipoprotein with Yx(FWY)xxD motif